jgi:hypothetical protein
MRGEAIEYSPGENYDMEKEQINALQLFVLIALFEAGSAIL